MADKPLESPLLAQQGSNRSRGGRREAPPAEAPVPQVCQPLSTGATNSAPAVVPEEEKEKVKESKEFQEIKDYILKGFNNKFQPIRFWRPSEYTILEDTPDGRFGIVEGGKIEFRVKAGGRSGSKNPISAKPLTSVLFITIDEASKKYLMIAGDSSGKVLKYSYPDLKKISESDLHTSPVTCLKYSNSKNCVYSVGNSLVQTSLEDWTSTVLIESQVKSIDLTGETLLVCGDGIFVLNGVKFTDEGFTVARANEKFVAAANESTIKVWTSEGELRREICHSLQIVKLEFVKTEDGFGLLSYSKEKVVKIWNIYRDAKEITIKSGSGIIDVVKEVDGESFYALTKEKIENYLIPAWPSESIIRGTKPITGFFSGKTVTASISKDSLTLWKENNFSEEKVLSFECLNKIILSNDEHHIYYLLNNKDIYCITLIDFSKSLLFSSEKSQIGDFSVSPDHTILVYSTKESELVVHNIPLSQEIRRISTVNRSERPVAGNIKIINNYVHYSAGAVFSRLSLSLPTSEVERLFSGWGKLIDKVRPSPDGEYFLESELPKDGEGPNLYFKIFHYRKMRFIKNVTHHQAPITDFLFPEGDYFFVASEDKTVSIWSRNTLDLLTSLTFSKPVRALGLNCDYSKLMVAEETDIFISANPLNTSTVQVFGPSNEDFFEYLNYLKALIDASDRENDKAKFVYKPEMDKYVIAPSLMNTVHFYAWFTYGNIYEQAIKTSSFHNTPQGKNPLTLLLIRDEPELAIRTLEAKCEDLEKNPYALGFLNTRTLVELNQRGYPGLEGIYHNIYQPVLKSRLPKYCSETYAETLPKSYYNTSIDESSEFFGKKSDFPKEGVPVLFYVSKIGVNMISGSQDSLDFLKSVIDCPNDEIFTTKFVRLVLTDKWGKVKWMMAIQGLLYLLYLVSLCFFIAGIFDQKLIILLGTIANNILIIYEIAQMRMSGLEYWSDVWNQIDISRYILFTIQCLLSFFEIDIETNIPLIVLVVISWVRGLTYFRIFDSTRYLTSLIFEVLKDMMSFMVLTFYSMVGLSLMLYATEHYGSYTFPTFLGYAYMTTIGEYGSFDQDIKNFEALWRHYLHVGLYYQHHRHDEFADFYHW